MKYKNYTIVPQESGFDLLVEEKTDSFKKNTKNDTRVITLSYNMSIEYIVSKIIEREAKDRLNENDDLKAYLNLLREERRNVEQILK